MNSEGGSLTFWLAVLVWLVVFVIIGLQGQHNREFHERIKTLEQQVGLMR